MTTTNKTASRLLLAVLIGIGIFGLAFFLWFVPQMGRAVLDPLMWNEARRAQYDTILRAWLAFAWVSAVPCYAALAIGIRVAIRMGRGEAFSKKTATCIQHFAWCAMADTILVFAVNIAFLALDFSHPAIFIAYGLVVLLGIAIYILFRILAAYVYQAAALREEQELTV